MNRIMILALCALLFFGCEQKKTQAPQEKKGARVQLSPGSEVPSKPVTLLKSPIKAVRVETTAEAIPTWREFSSAKPTLILLSQNPQLQPIPDEVKTEAITLVHNGNLIDFQKKATSRSANPTILSHMALSAALEAGLFSRIIWVLPVKKGTPLSVETFRKQMLSTNDLSKEEAASFELKNGSFIGEIRGVPVQATPLYALTPLKGPLLLHLDLGFFPPLYSNEIKTPLHTLIYTTLKALRAQRLSVMAVTLSQSNLSGDLPLKVRFLGDLVVRLLQDPERLDQPLPTNDSRRNEALYLANFFQKEKVLELYRQMENDSPTDATIKYDLYQTIRQFKQGNQALGYLAQAVELDPLFALEYLELATLAQQKNRPDEALRMLRLAADSFPEDPFILLNIAEINQKIGHTKRSKELVDKLKLWPWSPIYHPGINKYLSTLGAVHTQTRER